MHWRESESLVDNRPGDSMQLTATATDFKAIDYWASFGHFQVEPVALKARAQDVVSLFNVCTSQLLASHITARDTPNFSYSAYDALRYVYFSTIAMPLFTVFNKKLWVIQRSWTMSLPVSIEVPYLITTLLIIIDLPADCYEHGPQVEGIPFSVCLFLRKVTDPLLIYVPSVGDASSNINRSQATTTIGQLHYCPPSCRVMLIYIS